MSKHKIYPAEPKPGEIWEAESGRAALILGEDSNTHWRALAYNARLGIAECRLHKENAIKPWPAEEAHGFEALIELIRGAER